MSFGQTNRQEWRSTCHLNRSINVNSFLTETQSNKQIHDIQFLMQNRSHCVCVFFSLSPFLLLTLMQFALYRHLSSICCTLQSLNFVPMVYHHLCLRSPIVQNAPLNRLHSTAERHCRCPQSDWSHQNYPDVKKETNESNSYKKKCQNPKSLTWLHSSSNNSFGISELMKSSLFL